MKPPAVNLSPAVWVGTAGGKLRPNSGSAGHDTAGGPRSLPPALCHLSLAVLAQTAGGKVRPADHNLPPAKKKYKQPAVTCAAISVFLVVDKIVVIST